MAQEGLVRNKAGAICYGEPREVERLALDVGGWHNPEDKESTARGSNPQGTKYRRILSASARYSSPTFFYYLQRLALRVHSRGVPIYTDLQRPVRHELDMLATVF